MLIRALAPTIVLLLSLGSASAWAAPIYLNNANITVQVGPGTSPGTFNNTFSGGTIEKVIDAPSADAEEFHNQTTHIWFTADELRGAGTALRLRRGVRHRHLALLEFHR